jgi:acetyl esterase/lipase
MSYREAPMEARRPFRYGALPSQYVQAWLPHADPPYPAAVLIHGGWWRARHDLHLMDELCADLASRGWLAWNVEFRRIEGDGGGWPATLDDVRAAIRCLAGSGLPVAPAPPVGIGHSAGGHLALLAATGEALAGVVALAPITDVARSAAEGLGEGAPAAFLGQEAGPDAYEPASPLHRLPLGHRQLLVHGDEDVRVPVEHSRAYVAAARAAGDPVEYVEIAGGDHFCVIDPAHSSWGRVRDWLSQEGHR